MAAEYGAGKVVVVTNNIHSITPVMDTVSITATTMPDPEHLGLAGGMNDVRSTLTSLRCWFSTQ